MELGNTHTCTCTPNRVYKKSYARASHIVTASEKDLEARLRKEIEKRGGVALKLLSQLHRGLPDRLILMPGGRTYFAEIKTTGKNPTKLQRHCHDQLRRLAFPVFVIDSWEDLDDVLLTIDTEAVNASDPE